MCARLRWTHTLDTFDGTYALDCDGQTHCIHSTKLDGTCALDCDGHTHCIHSTKLDGTCALDCAMDRHIAYTRPSLTEHVRSTVRLYRTPFALIT
ncbi:hypothetical protein AeMF1_008323 [Aphanomyces euteiches]|nr:hypothetical protein AeMF1_008323 [Aphanomyces euteiches]